METELEMEIAVEKDLSFGIGPPADAFTDREDELWKLQDELAQLQHYESYEDKVYNPRFQQPAAEEISIQLGPMWVSDGWSRPRAFRTKYVAPILKNGEIKKGAGLFQWKSCNFSFGTIRSSSKY